MKKRVFAPLLALCLALGMIIPAFAVKDYGMIYDGTGILDENAAAAINDSVFAEFGGKHGIQLRADVVTDLEGYTIEDYAALFFDQYKYGDETTGYGFLLMLQLHEDETGLAFDDYCLLPGGATSELVSKEALDGMYTLLDQYLSADAWSGDLTADNKAFQDAMAVYASGVEAYLSNGLITSADGYEVAQTAGEVGSAAVTEAESGFQQAPAADTDYVRDEAGLLTEAEEAELEKLAATISSENKCGVYILTVEDFTANGADTIRNFSKGYYKENALGWGSGKDGEMLVLSMAERDYWLLAYGDFGNAAFTDHNKSELEDAFLDDFKGNDWYGGFSDYLTESREMLQVASGNAEPTIPWKEIGIAVLASCVIALIVCLIFKAQMKSARIKTDASDYVLGGAVSFYASENLFTHTTETREVIRRDNDGGTTIDSDGFSGSGGKF